MVEQVTVILAEITKGKKLEVPTSKTKIEESEKMIKLLLQLGEMKPQIEHFAKEAEQAFPPLTL